MTAIGVPWSIYELFRTLRDIPGHKLVHYCGTNEEGSFKMIDRWLNISTDFRQLLTDITRALNESSSGSLSVIVQHTDPADIDPATQQPFTNVFSFMCLREELWRMPFYITQMCSQDSMVRYV
jgi:hypothetical protein